MNVVIGGGLVGLATAYTLANRGEKVVVLEKEAGVARHQSGNNSGVIHAGMYYRPGSQKALNCRRGVELMRRFCDEEGIAVDVCGKVIVATSEDELPRLQELQRRGVKNGVPGLEMLTARQLAVIEPSVSGIAALHSSETAIVDYKKVAVALAGKLDVRTGCEVLGIEEGCVRTTLGDFEASRVINCAGLQAAKVAAMTDRMVEAGQILPFRGEYYRVPSGTVNGLVYPVPDPQFPFLGVHVSKKIDGTVEAGPNAVLQWSWSHLAYAGFWAMSRRYWRVGAYELYRSHSKGAFLRSLQRLVPDLKRADLSPGGFGVRAQRVLPNGDLHDDFCIVEGSNCVHVLNAPSPGATSCLAIAETIANTP